MAANASAGAGDSGARQKVHRSGKNAVDLNSQHPSRSQAALLKALEANLARATEPELRARLVATIMRLRGARS